MNVDTLIVSEELQKHYQELLDFKEQLFREDTYSKASEKVSLMNSISRLLAQLTNDIEKINSAEKFAKAKQILISILKEVDEQIAEEFIMKCREQNV